MTGDSHLVECSTHEAAQILQRRCNSIDQAVCPGSRLADGLDSNSEIKLPAASDGGREGGGLFEIAEEYDEAIHGPLSYSPSSQQAGPSTAAKGADLVLEEHFPGSTHELKQPSPDNVLRL